MSMPIFDCFDTSYKHPFGAIRRGQPSMFNIRLPKTLRVSGLTLVMFRPGFKERFEKLELQDESGDDNIYSVVYTPNHIGLHHYYFTGIIDDRRRYIKRTGANLGVFDGEELFQLTVFDENLYTPDFVRGGIMYQIFPDRFYKSGVKHENVPNDRVLRDDWLGTPYYRPDEKGIVRNNDFFGGDLRGIIEKLPYIQSLGVSIIYLNPIFESHENHRYSTANYEKIDPLLGTEEDFKELCQKANEMGIEIILDGVFSHTGADSIYFNKFGRYGEHTGAYRDRNSPYFPWYSFTGYPDRYESWWGITTLPNVDENNDAYTNYICGDDGILQKWIKLGARGWRLDVADELPDDFLDNLNKSVKKLGDDKIIYGEVWEDASNKESYGIRRRYLVGGQLDSVMNYPFKEAILNYVKYANAKEFTDSITTILEHYPKPAVDMLMNFISTHDTERALTRLGGEDVGWHDKDWQCERYLNPAESTYGLSLLRCAMVLQFFLPGIPCIYYGDEVGMEGYRDPFNRRCFPWGNENIELLNFTRTLARIRKGTHAFEQGALRFIEVDDKVCVFARFDRITRDGAIICLNKSTKSHTFDLRTEKTDMFFDLKLAHCRYATDISEDGTLQVAPFDFAVVYCKV
ncbi:MAG: glycoside hydrolase family 13 protein [Oscillospiraceae bacterium]|nr:glycoside hydrolase family 13 protein [Oscillospiraceae bacterium]